MSVIYTILCTLYLLKFGLTWLTSTIPTNQFKLRTRRYVSEKTFVEYNWDSSGSQEDFMESDLCIAVDENDYIIGQSSKKEAHIFDHNRPHGILHRAFSVFLFNSNGQLLLQQRAQHKITFPGVWTNTCCSHPLVGCFPQEEDTQEQVLKHSAPGIRNAIIRKLDQELGIKPQRYVYENLKLVTRLHYCASDSKSYLPTTTTTNTTTMGASNINNTRMTDNESSLSWCWGEHELDYILILQLMEGDTLSLNPNPDEVEAIRYVTQNELKDMLSDEQQYQWSPWFRIIATKFLFNWWENLSETLALPFDRTIHRF